MAYTKDYSWEEPTREELDTSGGTVLVEFGTAW